MRARLDCIGLKCPLPVLRTRKALGAMAAGDVLDVACTDPVSEIDIPVLLQETGDSLEAVRRDGEVVTFTVRKVAR